MSVWYQIDEVQSLGFRKILEIGPGPGVFSLVLRSMGLDVTTVDIDPALEPDIRGSLTRIPVRDRAFDVACAFQALEHLPFDESLEAMREMRRVARHFIVISLPDAKTLWPYSFHVPKVGEMKFFVPRPRFKKANHEFDGQHYWEINKRGYDLKRIARSLEDCAGAKITKTYRVHEYPYHRFFVFSLF
jgi:predicted SAM-dependent methyltransferase